MYIQLLFGMVIIIDINKNTENYKKIHRGYFSYQALLI